MRSNFPNVEIQDLLILAYVNGAFVALVMRNEFINNMTEGSMLTYLLQKLQQVLTIKIPTLLFQVSGLLLFLT